MERRPLAVLSWMVAASIIAALPVAAQQGARILPEVWTAVVEGIERRNETSFLSVRYIRDSRRERVALRPPDVPGAYAEIVEPDWSRQCSYETGQRIRISRVEDLVPVAIQRAVSSSGSAPSGGDDWQLCYVRLYFDLGSSTASLWLKEQWALFVALRCLAEYKLHLPVWVRGSAEQVLLDYRRRGWIATAAERHGQPALASSEEEVRALLLANPSRLLLAKVMPIQYESWKEKPIGGWPYFIVAAYEDRGGAKPKQLLDYSAKVR